MANIQISRKWAMPNKQTFLIKPIREFILDNIKTGIVVDPFANNMNIANDLGEIVYISNDLDRRYHTNFHMDATEFLKTIESNSVDCVLYDPPYSPRQVSESYKELGLTVNMQTTQSSYWAKQKAEIARILKVGGGNVSLLAGIVAE